MKEFWLKLFDHIKFITISLIFVFIVSKHDLEHIKDQFLIFYNEFLTITSRHINQIGGIVMKNEVTEDLNKSKVYVSKEEGMKFLQTTLLAKVNSIDDKLANLESIGQKTNSKKNETTNKSAASPYLIIQKGSLMSGKYEYVETKIKYDLSNQLIILNNDGEKQYITNNYEYAKSNIYMVMVLLDEEYFIDRKECFDKVNGYCYVEDDSSQLLTYDLLPMSFKADFDGDILNLKNLSKMSHENGTNCSGSRMVYSPCNFNYQDDKRIDKNKALLYEKIYSKIKSANAKYITIAYISSNENLNEYLNKWITFKDIVKY